MKRKTVNSILKGVAGVGLTLGGVSALSDANLVFASEVEQPEQETPGGETRQEETVEQTQGDNSSNVDETSSAESDQSDSSETGKSDYEIARQEHLDKQPDATCTMSTVADAMIKAAEPAQADADDSAATSDSTDVDASKSDNVSEGEDTPQNPEEGNNDQNQAESNEESPELKKLREEMEAKLKEVNDIVADRRTENHGNGTISGTNYYRQADELAKLMIKYYTAAEGFDGTVDVTKSWVSNGIDHDNNFKQNFLQTTYKDALGEILDIIYYDYVNADAEGEILTDTKNENKADLIDHIVIYEKAPVFAVDDEKGSFYFNEDGNFIGENDSFTFVRDECRNIVAYIIDGQRIEVKVDDNGERYIVDSENEDGSVVTTTVTGNNASGYIVTKTQTVKKEDGTEEKTTSEKTYTKLKGFSSGLKGKGEVYKKDLPKEPEKEPENDPVTEYTDPYTPGPSEPSTPATPQPETPETEIEDEDVPLADVPDVDDEDIDLDEDLDEDVTDLEDEDVPLAVLDLDEPVDIPDADVPLSDNPETGDALTATWLGTAAASVAGLFGASRKKRKG